MNAYNACGHCDHHNYTSARFCGQCGRSLSLFCRSCQAQVQASDLHCSQCGCKLAVNGPQDPKESGYADDSGLTGKHLERRQVTVQFCDLCGSTDLSDRLDPEDLVRVLRLYQDACTPILRAYDGFISQYLGDGIITLFGYPTAQDDTAYHAVAAALEIVEHFRLHAINIDGNERFLSVRIGVATGMVLAGDLIGKGHSAEQPVVGQTPNLAARLQAQAEENTVVISELTHRLTRRQISCEKMGPLSLKGISKPVNAYRALHLAPPVEVNVDLPASGTPHSFVNRVSEMAQLMQLWEKSNDSQGQALLITAEPGMGKTCLLQNFLTHLPQGEILLIPLKCSSNATNTPLHPLIELLLDELPSWVERQVVSLKRLENTDDALPVIATLDELSDALTQMRAGSTTEEPVVKKPGDLFISFVRLVSEYLPVVIYLEDVHWADPTTLTMVSRLGRNINDRRVLCVLLGRSQLQVDQWMPDTVIALDRLDQSDASQIVRNQVGTDALPGSLLEVILSKSEGVPLFVEEITNSFLDHRTSWRSNNSADTASSDYFTVPDTLRDLLMARLDSLGDAKRTAQLASVIGRVFTLSSVASLSGMPDDQLLVWIDDLLASGLVQVLESSDRISYQFKHALIQDAAYESLTRSNKTSLHARMAQLLQDAADQDALNAPEKIAGHYHAAGELYKAAFWWNKAAGNALGISANREAHHHAQQGINLLDQLSADQQSDHLALSLHVYLSSAIAGTQGDATPELEGIHAKAASLLESVNDDRLAFALTREMHAFFLIRGPVQRACELGRSLLKLAETSEQPQIQLDSLRSLGWTYFCHGQLQEGRDLLEMSRLAYRKADSRLHTQHDTIDPGAVGLINLAWAESLLANESRAKALVEQGTSLAVEIEHPYSLTYSLCMGGAVLQCCNEPNRALVLVDQALEIARKNEFQYFVAWGNALRGWLLSTSGIADNGLEFLLLGQNQYEATGARLFMPYILTLHADALILDQQLESAKDLLERAITVADDNEIHFFSGETLRLLAVAYDRLGNEQEASRLFDKAAKLVAEQGAVEIGKRIEADRINRVTKTEFN